MWCRRPPGTNSTHDDVRARRPHHNIAQFDSWKCICPTARLHAVSEELRLEAA